MTTIIFRDQNGRTPLVDWLHGLPKRARFQCLARLRLLAQHGYQLRRPAADYLRDGIYELRAKAERIQYRMLYFFHGQEVVVVSHGIIKHGAVVPPIEIERALQRKRAFEANPLRHTYKETG